MLALRHDMNNILLKCLVVALVILVGVIVVVVCGGVLCSTCAHACAIVGDRSGPLRRLARWLSRFFDSVASLVLAPLAATVGALESALDTMSGAPTLLKVASLRI